MTSSTAAPAASVDEKARLRHCVTVLIAVARVCSTFREAQGIVGEQPGTADGSAAKAHDRASRWLLQQSPESFLRGRCHLHSCTGCDCTRQAEGRFLEKTLLQLIICARSLQQEETTSATAPADLPKEHASCQVWGISRQLLSGRCCLHICPCGSCCLRRRRQEGRLLGPRFLPAPLIPPCQEGGNAAGGSPATKQQKA